MSAGKINALKIYLDGINCRYKEHEPMSQHTSFRIGGPADIYISPETEDKLQGVIDKCGELNIPVTAVGKGTNMLVSDDGIEGAVISTLKLCELKLEDDTNIVCGAGVKMSRLCNFALEHSLTGLEFAWGLPGSAGGAAFMNAGCYGGEMKDILNCCRHISLSGEPGSFSGGELKLGYRTSAYSEGGRIITSLTLSLSAGDRKDISSRMEELLNRRLDKQPYYQPSAGSVFKRPEGNFAGTLIEKSGLKGCKRGGAQVSEKHAGFIVNTGGATCADVLALIDDIKSKVLRDFGVELECEIKQVGR